MGLRLPPTAPVFIQPTGPTQNTGSAGDSSGTFTATATGFASGTTSGTAHWRITGGGICTLWLPLFNGVSNSNTFTVTGIPAVIQPATLDQEFRVGGADNSVESEGVSIIVTHGSSTIVYFINGSPSGWTAAGNKTGGINTVTYLLD